MLENKQLIITGPQELTTLNGFRVAPIYFQPHLGDDRFSKKKKRTFIGILVVLKTQVIRLSVSYLGAKSLETSRDVEIIHCI